MKRKGSFVLAYIRFFLAGVIVFTLLGTGTLYYIENYYIKSGGTVKVTDITKNVSKKQHNKTVRLNSTAQNVSCSYDGRYLTYMENGQLVITDLTNGAKTSVQNANGMGLNAYEWIYGRDRMFIVEKSIDADDGYYLKMYSYDMRDKKLQEIKRQSSGGASQKVEVPLYSKDDNVTQIDTSTDDNMTYLKISGANGNSDRIWSINIMAAVSRVNGLETSSIGRILSMKEKNVLLFENNKLGRVYSLDLTNSDGDGVVKGDLSAVSVNGDTALKLAGFDGNGNVYLEAMNANTVSAVYKGDPSSYSTRSQMQKIMVPSGFEAHSIFVTYSGGIYADDGEGSIRDLTAGKKISYKGKVAAVFDTGFLQLEDGELTTKYF